MKYLICLFVLMFVASASADYSFDIVNSTRDSVVFEKECTSNAACTKGGEEYCGSGQVNVIFCDKMNEWCEITCKPLTPKSVDSTTKSRFSIGPKHKMVGQPITFKVTDESGAKPIVCNVEIYYGGRWKSELMSGPSHWGGSMAVLDSFVETEYVDGSLIKSTSTDRQGYLEYVPQKPGRYVYKAMSKYVVMTVADNLGNVYNCSNEVCETNLGEDKTVCPQDCGGDVGSQAHVISTTEGDKVCGNQQCEPGESILNCPEDCNNTGTIAPPNKCGNGICDTIESSASCPQDCPVQACVQEGSSVPVIPNAPSCCAGLSLISCTLPDANGACPSTPCVGASYCANCGNGICGPGENRCNCPQDCVVQQTGGDNTMLIIIVIVVAAVAVVVLLLFFKKSGKPKQPSIGSMGAGLPPPPAPPAASGQTAQTTPALPGKCPKCGADVVYHDSFCTNCGSRVA